MMVDYKKTKKDFKSFISFYVLNIHKSRLWLGNQAVKLINIEYLGLMLMVSVLSSICVYNYNMNFPYQVSDVKFQPEDHPAGWLSISLYRQ